MPVNLKKTEFAPAGVQARSSSCTFRPEATGAGGKVQSKKNYTGWNANTYIHNMFWVYEPIIFTFLLTNLTFLYAKILAVDANFIKSHLKRKL